MLLTLLTFLPKDIMLLIYRFLHIELNGCVVDEYKKICKNYCYECESFNICECKCSYSVSGIPNIFSAYTL